MPDNEKQYSQDPTIRAGEITREQSFTETTDTEAFHQPPIESPAKGAPARYSDVPAAQQTGTAESASPQGATAKSGASASTSQSTSRSDLEGKTVAELKALAEKGNVEVERGDGKDGDPLHADYVDALASD